MLSIRGWRRRRTRPMRTGIMADRNRTIDVWRSRYGALASVRTMSLPGGAPDAPYRDRGHQQRDQHVVAGQRQAEEAPLHFVAADHLHGVEALQQVAGAAEISDRAGAIGRPLPKMPFDPGVIRAEPGIAERGEAENGEASHQHGPRGIPGGGERHQRT